MSRKVAVVTGSNKGIGFAIVRGLCKQFDGDVFLTARNEANGKQAVEDLKKEGLNPLFHQLDITDRKSIEVLRDFFQENYGGLDVLVNNAALAFKVNAPDPFSVQAEVTVKTNYFATRDCCNILFPILRSGARVVNVSGMSGTLAWRNCSDSRKQALCALSTEAELDAVMEDFVKSAKEGNFAEKGWPQTALGCSKIGVSAMSEIQHKVLSADESRPDIIVNACCPGYVITDMSSFKGHKTIDQGADTPLYLALLPPNVNEPRGQFVSDRTIKVWNP